MNPSSVGIMCVETNPKARVLILVAAATLGNCLMAFCGQTVGDHPGKSEKPSHALLLVRSWSPESGVLVGWLPMHQTQIELEALDRSPGLHFNPNDALDVRWPVRPKQNPEIGGVMVTPPTKTFEGKNWVPAKNEPNLVKIGRRYYLIRTITFVENEPGLAAREDQQPQGITSFRPQ
jgi:hypothetical protein